MLLMPMAWTDQRKWRLAIDSMVRRALSHLPCAGTCERHMRIVEGWAETSLSVSRLSDPTVAFEGPTVRAA
jgi:hypothetical protein